MVSIGAHRAYSSKAALMAMEYARRHGYDFTVVHSDIIPPNRSPHYAKMRILSLFENYDQYCIVDDDLLLSQRAPSLPKFPEGVLLGMVPDPSQIGLPAGKIPWAGNTGFVLCKKEAAPLFEAAIELGDQQGLPGHADQPALNVAVWDRTEPMKLDWRWNYIPTVDYALNNGGWDKWTTSRFWRIRFYSSLLIGFGGADSIERIRSAYGLHLTCCLRPRPILRHFR